MVIYLALSNNGDEMSGNNNFIEITNKNIYDKITGLEDKLNDKLKYCSIHNARISANEKNISYLLYGVSSIALVLIGAAVL